MELVTRAFEIREFDKEERTITGLAVPYGQTANVGGFTERFEAGAFAGATDVKLVWNHDLNEVIGKVIRGEDTDEGYLVTAKISQTTRGNDVHTLLQDGVVDKFSVGFYPAEHRTEEDGTVVRTRVDLKEVSVVPIPAYAGASISEVRSENTKEKETVSGDTTHRNMTEVKTYDDSEIRSKVEGFERDLAVALDKIGDNNSAEPAWQYRSAGELVQGLKNGDESAKSELRAYTGAKLADSQLRPGWINNGLSFIAANRTGFNLFRHAPLESEGMSFVIPTVASTTIQVGKQVAEGDTLAYGKLVTSNKTITVDTYGGYIEYSKQVKERGSVDYVNTAVQLLADDYARKTNAAVVSAVLADAGVNTGTGVTLSTSTVANWETFVDEGAAALADNAGVSPDFLWVSRDVFYKIKSYKDTTGRPLMEVNNDGSNTLGSANAVAISGRFQGVDLVVDSSLPAKTAVMGNSTAATVFEAPGAPFNLADQNITNLTEQIALYGYVAVGVLNPKALFKVAVA